jgi:hypothetical protein
MEKLGRDGRVPKKAFDTEVPVHSGMKFKRDGQLIAGISRTQTEHPKDGRSPLIHEPLFDKDIYKNGQAPTHFNQALRRENTATRGDANAVLRASVLPAGGKK